MRVAYFDCFAGLSGDMTVGALLDAGVDFEALKKPLSSLALSGYELGVEKVKRSGISATKFTVTVEEAKQPARTLAVIREIIHNSQLSEAVQARSIKVFEKLAEAEAHVHGSTIEQIHFHEVGAVDSIIDIVGAIIGFELLGVEKFCASPLRVGFGSINVAHGLMPVPAPGTAELLKGLPIYAGDIEGEFVTPTGAAMVAVLCESFGAMPAMQMERIGYGAGSRDPKNFPNALRIVLGEVEEVERQIDEAQTILVIETNLDDMNPQAYGYVMDKALALGALDVFLTPIQMKKDRPAVKLTVLCASEDFEALADLLLRETTTLGLRYYEARRRTLERRFEAVETAYGTVRVKLAMRDGRVLHAQPEYEDCAKIAEKSGVSLIEAQAAASAAFRELENKKASE
ncbi:MAG: nickel pincer cofactor biosynthesis protein LarC [Acidobacteria bacterium]|nr:nickel pincer cofactor biosynthesis protein LarC [Acidobacteriota bacterium]